MLRRSRQALRHRRRPDDDDVDRGPGRGDRRAARSRPAGRSSTAQLARLRGEVELPIPAASAVQIGGERAYRLARRGVTVEMPLRRSYVHALDVIAYTRLRACDSRCTSAPGRTSGPIAELSAATAPACAAPPSGRSRWRRPTPSGLSPSPTSSHGCPPRRWPACRTECARACCRRRGRRSRGAA